MRCDVGVAKQRFPRATQPQAPSTLRIHPCTAPHTRLARGIRHRVVRGATVAALAAGREWHLLFSRQTRVRGWRFNILFAGANKTSGARVVSLRPKPLARFASLPTHNITPASLCNACQTYKVADTLVAQEHCTCRTCAASAGARLTGGRVSVRTGEVGPVPHTEPGKPPPVGPSHAPQLT